MALSIHVAMQAVACVPWLLAPHPEHMDCGFGVCRHAGAMQYMSATKLAQILTVVVRH
jgi:hypothetical protein